jgi:hypothetical protein
MRPLKLPTRLHQPERHGLGLSLLPWASSSATSLHAAPILLHHPSRSSAAYPYILDLIGLLDYISSPSIYMRVYLVGIRSYTKLSDRPLYI